MRNIEIAVGEYYHIYNRGVDKQTLFHRTVDFERFLLLLSFCNNMDYLPRILSTTTLSVVPRNERLVAICCYVLMSNHFHLKLLQIRDGGIQQFLQRVQMAYAKYFNTQRERKGRLFESTYQCVQIENDAQWFHLANYIHLNPLDRSEIRWREGCSMDWEKVKMLLNRYRWSSYHLFSKANYREVIPIIDEEYRNDRVSNPSTYLSELRDWTSRGVLSVDIPGDTFDNT